MRNKFFKAAAAVGVWAAIAVAPAQAAIITGDGSLGDFTGNIDFSGSTLTVQLTNTSAAANGGFITGFVLNNPMDLVTGVTLSGTDADFARLGLDNNNVNGAPFGQFDFGAAISANFEGGGQPSRGIGVGSSATFVFSLTGELGGLTTQSFLTALSSGTGVGEEGYAPLVVRFRGFADGGSDKVAITPPGGTGNENEVPEPAMLGLLGLGVLGLAVARRRRA